MHEVIDRIAKSGSFLEEQAAASDDLGRLTDEVAERLRWTGVIRLLQTKEFGGYEAEPNEFFEALFAVGAHSGSAGWVSGVVGVHPWEMSQCDRRLQEEVWGEDPDTWIASPYAPMGRAKPVDGGWLLNGRWQFSSGTDHCSWIFLGGMVTDDAGNVEDPQTAVRHFVLPRSDYEIVPDSWNVIGLEGSGSKDIIVRDAFVPGYRVVDPADLRDGVAAVRNGRDNPLYKMPFSAMFSGAIGAGTIAMAMGALDASVEYTRNRVHVRGGRAVENVHYLVALAEASSDVAASRLQFLDGIHSLYTMVRSGRMPTASDRIAVRRDQVRSVRRAVDAVDKVFLLSGGTSLRRDQPLQRFWRDLHAGMNHLSNVAESTYEGYSLDLFGMPIPAHVLY